MLPYKTLIQIDRSASTPLYVQITSEVIRNITAGIISGGQKLPGTRKLSTLLDVHRKTVITAYDELESRGWIDIKPNQGCFVNDKLPIVSPQAPLAENQHKVAHFEVPLYKDVLVHPPQTARPRASLSIDDGSPDVRIAPLRTLSKHFSFVLNNGIGTSLMTYNQAYRGDLLLRKEVLRYLKESRGMSLSLDNILITRGSLMAFYLVFKTLLKPGDSVVVGYPGFNEGQNTIRMAGGTLIRVPVDQDGMDVDAIEQICNRKKIRAVFIISHHHYPTTVSLSASRRMHLLSLAKKHRFAIIEDDYDYDFHYSSSPLLPMASIDHAGSVVYVGSLSKIIAPSLRLGFLTGPENLINELALLSQYIDSFGNTALERAIALLFQEGDVSRHIRKAVRSYKQRRDLFCQLFHDRLSEAMELTPPEGGMALWVTFKENYPVNEIISQARKKGLHIPPPSSYCDEESPMNALRLGFASLDTGEIQKVFEVLEGSVRASRR